MKRAITVAAAQTGPVSRDEPRAAVVSRLMDLMREASARGARLVVFPEAALTPFFPHWYVEGEELDAYFDAEMPTADTLPLFELAQSIGVAFSLGYCEIVKEVGTTKRFNTSILVDADGTIVGKYRKIHLPGHHDYRPEYPHQNLETRYFDVGDLGFRTWELLGGKIGMCICHDRRWPETFRVLGLEGAELVTLGYNTPLHNPAMPETDALALFHNRLCMQAGAYQNGLWVVGVAKAGNEEDVYQIGGSCIIAPSGEIIASAFTDEDEVIVGTCDLDQCSRYKQYSSFASARQPNYYGRIVAE